MRVYITVIPLSDRFQNNML